MSRARVGIFTPDFHPSLGGIGAFALELYRRLLPDPDFEPFVFSPMQNELANHERIPATSSRTLGPLHFSVNVAARLPSLVSRYSLDLLHFHGSSGGVQILRKPARPVVLTLHNTYFYLYRRFGGPVFRTLRRVERRSLANADRIVPVSYGVRGELPVPDSPRVRVVQNGVDTSLFRPQSVAKERFFLYVGRLGRRKGLIELVEAFARARPAGFELRFGGDGPLREELPALARRLGIADRVRLLGPVARADLPALYARAHALVLPSWSEGFGLTVTEAMASGTLAIGTRIPGILEQIEQGKTGFFAEAQDVPSLARCLEEAAGLGAERLSAMSAAAAEAGQGRSIDVMIARYRDLYRELISG